MVNHITIESNTTTSGKRGDRMLFSMKGLRGRRVRSRDGGSAVIHDVCFDDRDWHVAYLTVEVGKAPPRRVQLPPSALQKVDGKPGVVKSTLRLEEIATLPQAEENPPVSVQREILPPTAVEEKASTGSEGQADPHLRCLKTIGYHVESKNGDVGRIKDFLVTPNGWRVPFFVVDAESIVPGKEVVISTQLIDEMRWIDTTARVPLRRDRFLNIAE